jgi:hypothetical protein
VGYLCGRKIVSGFVELMKNNLKIPKGLETFESTNIEGFINTGVYDRKIVPLPE